MSYIEYLKSPIWKETRSKKIKKTPKCFVCRTRKSIHIHHKKYTEQGQSILNREENRHLVALCGECHSLLHELVPKRLWHLQRLYNYARNYKKAKTKKRNRRECWTMAKDKLFDII